MKKAIILFPENKSYNEIEFLKNTAYELRDEPKGFIYRWIKRGCKEVTAKDVKKVVPDPRYPIDKVKSAVKTVTKKTVGKVGEAVKTINKVEANNVAVQKQEKV